MKSNTSNLFAKSLLLGVAMALGTANAADYTWGGGNSTEWN